MKNISDLTSASDYNKMLSQIIENYNIHNIINEMQSNKDLFMRLINIANYIEPSNDEELLTEDNLVNKYNCSVDEVRNIYNNISRYGLNYKKVLEAILEKDDNSVGQLDDNSEEELKDIKNTNGKVTDGKEKDDDKDNDKIKDNDKKSKYFFSNIIIFTNDTDPTNNKTLKNIEEAIKYTNINLIKFCSENVSYTATDKYIEINDSKTKYKIKDQSNIDTICIVRLGAQDNEQCIECIKEIQDWGIFTLNPIVAAQRASNKYQSAVLMKKYNIPQPRFALLNKSDTKNGIDSLIKKLDIIYPDTKEKYNSGDKNKKDEVESQEYVVKILDGHGGTGVFMVNGKTILAILQAIFAIDEDRELLLQRKEEADGGDIRVHVITLNNTQKIIASMKRVKISDDFRSNVSLGATAEPVKLSKEQEEIAMKVARISGMPWCAVDIMPLKKGSNKEIGDNVVLEYNSSPGTEGISEVIKHNFIEELFDAINNPDHLPLQSKQIAYIEKVGFKFTDDEDEKIVKFPAKFDTGNGSLAPTIGCDELNIKDNIAYVKINGKDYEFEITGEINPKVGQSKEKRITITIPLIQIGTRKLKDVRFALVDNRKDKSTRVLINRDIMCKLGFVINPNTKYLLNDN